MVQRRLVKLREAKRVPWGWITDGTRWVYGGNTYSGVGAFMEEAAQVYRRDVWQGAGERVEIWIEKDALSGVLLPVVVHQWGLPLYVAHGFSSLSYLQSAAEAATADGRPATIFALTDLDPAGIGIAKHVEAELRRRAPDVDIVVERLAVTPQQVLDWHLATRPTKAGDSRAARYVREYGPTCTELDAIAPEMLRSLVSVAIEEHAPEGFDQLRVVEAAERETLKKCAAWAQAVPMKEGAK